MDISCREATTYPDGSFRKLEFQYGGRLYEAWDNGHLRAAAIESNEWADIEKTGAIETPEKAERVLRNWIAKLEASCTT